MKTLFLRNSLLFLLSATSTRAQGQYGASPFVSRTVRPNAKFQSDYVLPSAQDIPRGGGAGQMLDPENAAKAFTVFAGAEGVVMNVGPKLCNKIYCIKDQDNDAMAQFLAGQFGAGILSYCIYLYFLLFPKTNLATANKTVYAFWLYQNLRQWLGGDAAK